MDLRDVGIMVGGSVVILFLGVQFVFLMCKMVEWTAPWWGYQ